MTVVFARYREGLCCESERVCHVLSVPGGGSVPRTLVSLCGQHFPPGVLERMPQWSGMPCVACTLLLPDQAEPGAVDGCALGGGNSDGGTVPEGYVGGAAFSGEALRHLVPKSTQRCRSLGRAVAVSECGHLAYDDADGSGPDPPEDWPVCSECADRAAGTGTALWRMPQQSLSGHPEEGAAEAQDGP